MDWQQINIQERNIQAAIHNMEEQNVHEEPVQNLMEQNMHEEPVQNLREINEHLNVAAQAIEWENNHAQMPPQVVPQPPMAQEAAAMSKREKRMLKQRQQEEIQRRQEEERLRQEEARRQAEEAQRRQQEEEARIRREAREARLRREEEERQEKRRLLFEDDTTLHAMEEMAQETDEAILQEKMQRFLKTAAKRLLELRPELEEDYQRTVNYVPVAESLKLIALEHAVNDEQLGLAEKAKQQLKAFEELNQENVLLRVIQFELADVFKEEYQALSGLEKASNTIMEQYQEKDQRQISGLEDLGQEVAEAFHMKSEDGKKVNVLEKGSPFAYLGKEESLEEYHVQVQRVMEQKHCTKEEAERQVIEKRRTILQQKALRKTMQGSVVKDITVEEWQRSGGASYHQTLPAGEALQIVEASHGYLYAEDVGDGLMELHHTLPETIQLNVGGVKKEYPLRRNYNLLMKCIATQMMDENGNMYQDEKRVAQMNELQNQLQNAASSTMDETKLKAAIEDSMELVFENKEEAKAETEQMCSFLKDMVVASGEGRFILKLEIVLNLGKFIQCFNSAGDTSYEVHIERLRKELLADPSTTETPEELEAILKQIPNVSLTEQKNRLEEALAGRSPEIIRKYVNALTSFHTDMDAAAMDMLDIRNMDIHSKDVPLSNACSANAYFYDTLNKIAQNGMESISYQTWDHLEEFTGEHLNYVYENSHKLSKFGENEAKLDEIRNKIYQRAGLTFDEKNVIYEVAGEAYKFAHHQAAQLGVAHDGTVMTCETFAAETTQAMVAPFVRRAAVGRYQGHVYQDGGNYKVSGMTRYYNYDNPLAGGEDIRPELKEIFLYQGIAGVEQYAKANG